MKVTKFVHSCLLVETTDPDPRSALFDPGVYSSFNVASLPNIDDIFITHLHQDHMDIERILQLRLRFPHARITAPLDARAALESAGVSDIQTVPGNGIHFFHAPHESVEPMGGKAPQEHGVHYLNILSHPGDSHSFHETMPILALPVSAPWGSTVRAVSIALELRPKYIIPIHDWHWHDVARMQVYDRLEMRFKEEGITFLKVEDGVPVTLSP